MPLSSFGSCPAGFVLSSGGCVLPTVTNCPFGFIATTAGCSALTTSCPAGFVLSNGGCVATTATTTTAVPVITTDLPAGCDNVVPAPGALSSIPIATILAMVQPSGIVVSAWQYSNSAHTFLALYFNTPGSPTDATAAAPGQSVFLCVSADGIFTTQPGTTAATTTTATTVASCPAGFILTSGGCVLATNTSCPAGFILTVGGCSPFTTSGCPIGSVLTLGGCLPTSSSLCPSGFVFDPTTNSCHL